MLDRPGGQGNAVRIGGLQKLSLSDYPGKVAAVVFVQGCNYRCPFCQNPHLVPRLGQEELPTEQVLAFLQRRRGKLDGVVLSGGEPIIASGLMTFFRQVKSLGFLVKLDTNGSRPVILERLLQKGLLDFVAIDIKGPPSRYHEIGGMHADANAVSESVRIVRESGIAFELRTTVVPGLVRLEDVEAIGAWLGGKGTWALQQFSNRSVLDPAFLSVKPYPPKTLEAFRRAARRYFTNVVTRA